MKHIRYGVMLSLAALLLPSFVFADTVRSIEFPVGGPNYYRDDWGEPRGGGTRKHQGNDIIAEKMTPLVAAVDGKVLYVVSPEASWGYEISLIDADGYHYDYLHVNNDNPGTDDDRGGESHAYAPGIDSGVSVHKGQLIGWVGDSGNAENTVPHLHFEIHDPTGAAFDPYQSLINATGPYKTSNPKLAITADVRAQLAKMQDGHPNDVFKNNLGQGDSGVEVKQLQISLKVVGVLDKESVTGYFGPKTRDAVMAFQKRQLLEQTGSVGPKTREALNRGLASGVLQEYKPYLNDAEQRAILIQKLNEQIKALQDRLKAQQGIR